MQDHHAIGNERPLVDASQDIELLAGHETDQFTVLKFKRSLKNCDDNDFDIEVRNAVFPFIISIALLMYAC